MATMRTFQRILLGSLLALATLVQPAFAQQVCDKDMYGKVFCAPLGGVLEKDAFGQYACSPGKCARDDRGRLLCSAREGGAVVIDPFKGIQCVGGCVQPDLKYCQTVQ